MRASSFACVALLYGAGTIPNLALAKHSGEIVLPSGAAKYPTPSGLNGTNTAFLTGTGNGAAATRTSVIKVDLKDLSIQTPTATTTTLAKRVLKI